MSSEAASIIRKIIHVDMDAFFASVEQRDEPSYKGKPLVVGGSPESRGVVAAASYEARQYGIHSAMPSRTALQRCPHLIFLRPRFEVYKAVSQQIREIFFQYTDLVEPLSLDEAYLDVSTNKKGESSATLIAREIKVRIFEETDLTASAGVSINKFLAKTASGLKKPNGLCLIRPEKAESFVETLEIEQFYGIGKVTAEKMRALGIFNGKDLKSWSEAALVEKFGKMGRFYYQIARAQDDRMVEPNRISKSVGAEESFAVDLSERRDMLGALAEIATTVERRLGDGKNGGRTVTLKVKYADYKQVTRSRTLAESVSSAESMLDIAIELLDDTEAEKKRVRLLGISVSNLDSERESNEFQQLSIDLH
ncbi:MAG: DNA polymerase IV [Candidatus Obscuribacterales bacterium]|nr:DNA polymerase IV [Candidatus Obscuribacterales bacterium]